jgi:hypothetical protein
MRRPSKFVPPSIPACLSQAQAQAELAATSLSGRRLHRVRRGRYVALSENAQPHAIARFSHPGEALVPLDHFLAAATRAYPGERERTETRAAELKNHLLAMLGRLPPGSPGIRRARTVIEHASPWSESAWETRLRWILLLAGFTSVELQVEMRVGGQRYRSDLAIPIGRRADGRTIWLHIEFVGRIKYGRGSADATSETVRCERERELSITGTGDRLVRFTAGELTDPDAVVTKVREQLTDVPLPPLRPVRSLAA